MSFVFETLKSDDLSQVNEFLIKHFFSREPLGLRLGIQPETDVREWLSQVTQPLLDQQVKFFSKFSTFTNDYRVGITNLAIGISTLLF